MSFKYLSMHTNIYSKSYFIKIIYDRIGTECTMGFGS